MPDKKGFSLIELIVVLLIVGILAGIAIAIYSNMTQQAAATAAENNLVSIYNAQKSYYFGPTGAGNYCTTPCDTLPDINTALGLNITDTNFTYKCITAAGPAYTCTATNNSDANLKLTVSGGPSNNTAQIVLPGGTGTPNPSCTDSPTHNCPT